MAAVRLQRFLSQAGVAARRKGELLIIAGRVRVNGRVVTELGTKVDPERDSVEVDGLVVAAQKKYYYLLNKPKGYITTVDDPEGRPTVIDLLPQLPTPVKPVGRLDFYTEGVLLLTNDGELQDALLSPRSDVKKTYHAKLKGEVPMSDVERLRVGVRITDNEGHSAMTLPAQVDVLRRTGVHTWLVITIREGRSRQIHRMAEALGYQVLKLARVSFADLTYHGLKIGECRPLTMREIHDLRRLAKLTPDIDVAPSPPAGAKREPAWKTGRGGRTVTNRAPARVRTDAHESTGDVDRRAAPPSRQPAHVRGQRPHRVAPPGSPDDLRIGARPSRERAGARSRVDASARRGSQSPGDPRREASRVPWPSGNTAPQERKRATSAETHPSRRQPRDSNTGRSGRGPSPVTTGKKPMGGRPRSGPSRSRRG